MWGDSWCELLTSSQEEDFTLRNAVEKEKDIHAGFLSFIQSIECTFKKLRLWHPVPSLRVK